MSEDKEKVLNLIDEIKEMVINEDIEFIELYSSHSYQVKDHQFSFRINGSDEEYERGYNQAIKDMKEKLGEL